MCKEIRAWQWDGEFFENAVTNLEHASEANVENVGIYMLPCRGEDGPLQLELMVDTLTQDNENNLSSSTKILSFEEKVEEIARMLSADKITEQARAAALKLIQEN